MSKKSSTFARFFSRKRKAIMKKVLFIVCAVVLMAGLAGCKKSTQEIEKAETIDLSVAQRDWLFDDQTLQFYCDFDMPEITAKMYNYGSWTLNREYNRGYRDAYQVALPMSEYAHDTLVNGSVLYYTRHTDYRIAVGYIDVQVTYSDFPFEKDASGKYNLTGLVPEGMDFHLQLVY